MYRSITALALIAVTTLGTGCLTRHGRLHPAWALIGLAAEIASDIQQAKAAAAAERREEQRAAYVPPPPSAPDPEVGELQRAPAGFYCARSTTEGDISLCTRDLEACIEARDAATLGVPDLAPCRGAETAWCFAGRCYANQASCERRRGPDSVGRCNEID